ncbi:MAG TPA: hypothetical protein VGE08_26110 [Steroidobacter sp.]|uniref:hypothetical protein n=1 Tax=Steroidobacter sp. TaxID=1978227 RepID=UPI002EDBAA4B
MLETRHARRLRLVALAFVLLMTGCGEDAPPEQATLASPSLNGIAVYDDGSSPGAVTAKGTAGLPRTASNSSGTSRYTVDISQLTGPYALRWAGTDKNDQQVSLYSVATQAGVANVTPLTTLLFAQLMGQDPEAAYAAFGASGADLVSDEKIREAQAKLTAHLRDVLGVTVPAAEASFITSTFDAVPGDPMFETMQAVEAALVANGTTLEALSQQVASLARLCIEEKILIDVGGAQREFCPATKSAERDEEDGSIINYVFTTPTNDTLIVRVRGDEVLSGEYVAAGLVYSCSGAACGSIVLGAPASDQTRTLSFESAAFGGDAGNAVLNGVLGGAIPGVELPVLPCAHNKYFVILDDNSVVAECVDTFDPFSIGGTMSALRGVTPSRAIYRFSSSSSIDPTFPQLELVMDGNDSLVSVYFYRYDPETFVPDVRFACEAEACNGITLGSVTVNTSLGPDYPVLVRDVTFADTILSGMTESGAPTGAAAKLRAAVTTVYYVDPYAPFLHPPLEDCDPTSATVSVDVHSGPFNFCSAEAIRYAFMLNDTDLRLEATEDRTLAPLQVDLRGESVLRVYYNNGMINQSFHCELDCEGVTVSPPDSLGRRTVTFDGTVLHEDQSFPRPGTRTATFTGGPIVFPPVTP